MSLLGSESWDSILTADIPDWWTGNSSGNAIVAGQGRCDSAALKFNSSAGQTVTIGTNPVGNIGYTGFGRKMGEDELGATLLFLSGSFASPQLLFTTTGGGGLAVYRGPNTVLGVFLGATPNGLLTEGHYYHIGLEWECVDSNGYVKIWVNGVLQLHLTGINTRSTTIFAGTASVPWSVLSYGGRTGYIDDIYWGDGNGAAPWNAFLGDLRVECQVAQTDSDGGGGTHQDFLPSSGSDHGALVDDVTPDDNATYVESSTPGDIETFQFPAITLTTGTVYGVQLMPNVIKTDSGGRTVACVVRQGGVDTVGTTQGLSQANYIYAMQMFQLNPTTNTAWTATTANNMEGGIKVID